MSPSYLVDTNICIAYKKRKSGIPERLEGLPAGAAVMSLVTWGELVLGAEKSQRPVESFAILERVRQIIPVLGMEEKVGNHYGNLRGTLEKAGRPIGPNDMWIAAHALSRGLKLVTNNTGEFSRVAGLDLEDWTASWPRPSPSSPSSNAFRSSAATRSCSVVTSPNSTVSSIAPSCRRSGAIRSAFPRTSCSR